jgi:hypothetical protein
VRSDRKSVQRDESSSPGGPAARRAQGLPDSWRSLHVAAGNRAVGRLLQRRGPKQAEKPPAADAATKDDVILAKQWVHWCASRGRGAKPTRAVPKAYAAHMQVLLDAIMGPEEGKQEDELIIGDARAFLRRRLRADHDRLDPQGDDSAFRAAEIALQRAEINRAGGPGAFHRAGATELDVARTLSYIGTEAREELAEAKRWGYRLPPRFATLGDEADARFKTASRGWTRGAPSGDRSVAATDEAHLVGFRDEALALIGSMRARRAADIYRARQAEAEALRETAARQLAELRVQIADQRHALFMAGETGALKKLHTATGTIVRAIGDIEDAAAIITKRVEQINTVTTAFEGGKPVINLPKLPGGITDAVGLVKKAHEKITTALELIDLIGPAKTSFDDGMKYLKSIDMALDAFSGKHPVLKIYSAMYLGPALKVCIKNLGVLAAHRKSSNRGAISNGMPDAVSWGVEPGGEAMYRWLVGIFKQGHTATLPDEVYEYLDDHDDDISAAVRDPLPSRKISVNGWAERNRFLIWEAMYGSARPPS